MEPQAQENGNGPSKSAPTPVDIESVNFKKFGIIREFGANDRAAVFGLLPEAGSLETTKIIGPAFIKRYQVGKLTPSVLDKLFSKSSKPLSDRQKQELLNGFSGATVIYIEQYLSELYNQYEVMHEIVVTGNLDGKPIEFRFQFEALPNPNGNCRFHKFAVLTRY